ncbi:MAG: DUF3094 family protein [Exilibacterium sp.]
MDSNQLSQEDQERVNRFLASGVNSVPRKPFRPWLLMGGIWLVMALLSGVSYLIARYYGVM